MKLKQNTIYWILPKHITCFKAPTSLVPSPHIKVNRPTVLKVVMISSFCSGATLAKTWDKKCNCHWRRQYQKLCSNVLLLSVRSKPSNREWPEDELMSVATSQCNHLQYRDHESLIKTRPLSHWNQLYLLSVKILKKWKEN